MFIYFLMLCVSHAGNRLLCFQRQNNMDFHHSSESHVKNKPLRSNLFCLRKQKGGKSTKIEVRLKALVSNIMFSCQCMGGCARVCVCVLWPSTSALSGSLCEMRFSASKSDPVVLRWISFHVRNISPYLKCRSLIISSTANMSCSWVRERWTISHCQRQQYRVRCTAPLWQK